MKSFKIDAICAPEKSGPLDILLEVVVWVNMSLERAANDNESIC